MNLKENTDRNSKFNHCIDHKLEEKTCYIPHIPAFYILSLVENYQANWAHTFSLRLTQCTTTVYAFLDFSKDFPSSFPPTITISTES